jgi:hypothetical protein
VKHVHPIDEGDRVDRSVGVALVIDPQFDDACPAKSLHWSRSFGHLAELGLKKRETSDATSPIRKR